jgi:hypothetical protein
MANVKISDLTAATTPLAGSELFETVQGGSSKKVAASAIGNSATAVPFASLAGRAYLNVNSTTDQTGSTASGTAVRLENTVLTSGITVANNGSGIPTRITFAVAGIYTISPNLQFKNTDTTNRTTTVWLRKNGTDVAASAVIFNVPKAADGGVTVGQIVTSVQVTAGQYIEVMWLPETTAVTLDFTAASALAPVIPSVIVISERIA